MNGLFFLSELFNQSVRALKLSNGKPHLPVQHVGIKNCLISLSDLIHLICEQVTSKREGTRGTGK